jgi:hypothetical protein
MRIGPWMRSALLMTVLVAPPMVATAQVNVSITVGPPELPEYEQPAMPDVGYLWAPGYWAYGDDGYYWVPGTWVLVPEQGLLWTPGYWEADGGNYAWHDGYWASRVGYYGGINYGYGYGGNGYEGGYWQDNHLYYNRSVNNISTTTNVTTVYTKTVIVNNNRPPTNWRWLVRNTLRRRLSRRSIGRRLARTARSSRRSIRASPPSWQRPSPVCLPVRVS